MPFRFASLLATAFFTVSTACGAWAAETADDASGKPLTKAEVQAIVKQVIRDNPDLILRTLSEYEMKEQASRISKAARNITKLQDKIQHDPRSPSIGNPKGDVTVVEFFDYHCGYCKRFFPEIPQLLNDDKQVRIVFKELPILSEDSATAAKAALAVYSIDPKKYFDYHILLMKSSNGFNEEVLTAKAKEIGIAPEIFKKAFANPALQKDIDANHQLAQSLAISGTPAILVGTELLPGAVSYETLKQKIAEVRDSQLQKHSDKEDDKAE